MNNSYGTQWTINSRCRQRSKCLSTHGPSCFALLDNSHGTQWPINSRCRDQSKCLSTHGHGPSIGQFSWHTMTYQFKLSAPIQMPIWTWTRRRHQSKCLSTHGHGSSYFVLLDNSCGTQWPINSMRRHQSKCLTRKIIKSLSLI